MQLKFQEDKLICAFSGRLDTERCLTLEKELDEDAGKSTGPVVFDLAEVDYIASSFLRICIKYAKKLGKENFSLINTSPALKKVFKIAGFDELIRIL
jgi:anti-anti-sigma factor